MAFFRKQRRKHLDLLGKQHPRMRGRSRQLLLRKLLLACSICLVGALGTWLVVTRYLTPLLTAKRQPTELKQIQITVDSPKNLLLSETERLQLHQKLSQFLVDRPNADLQQLANKILQNSSLEQLYLQRPTPTTLYAKAWKRTPIFVTELDHLYYVTSKGVVYGQANEDPTGIRLPVLKGLFTDRTRQYSLSEQNSITITPFEQEILQEAGQLLQTLQEENFPITAIEFVLHRGFFCQLANTDTTIAFGRAPFSRKISKLQKVLAHLAEKGTSAKSIELDYSGKAFIKEKLQ